MATWQVNGPYGRIARGTYPVPSDLTLRIRYDGSQVTVSVNGVTYATLPFTLNAPSLGGISIEFGSRDYTQPSAIRVKDFSFTALP